MGKTAFLFPGQGVQSVGMGESFHQKASVSSLYARANEATGRNLRRLILEGPQDLLAQTQNAQPAVFTDSLARFKLLKDAGITPDYLLGHSLGEFSAIVAAGCLSFGEAIELVNKRGELSQQVQVDGTMVAVLGLSYEEVQDKLTGPAVSIANFNSPRQIVISGKRQAVQETTKELKSEGAKCIQLEVSGPFHSPYMEEIEHHLKGYIDKLKFSDPSVPVFSGVSGCLETTGERLKELLAEQMTKPVLWVQYVRKLEELGTTATVEVGPDSTLTNLTTKISAEIDAKSFEEVM